VVLVGWISRETNDSAIAITTQKEGRRGVREDGDPTIRGLYRLVSGLPTPLRALFHWPFRRRNIFLAFLIRSLRSSMSVSRVRMLRCSSVDL
jgi:hypothetical protein